MAEEQTNPDELAPDGSSAAKLKSLKGRVKKLRGSIEHCSAVVSDKSAEKLKLQEELRETERQINLLKQMEKGVVVSEHAILRYLERTGRVNIQEVSAEIASANVRSQYRELCDGNFPIEGTHLKAVVKGGVVVTVKGKRSEDENSGRDAGD